MSRAVTQRTRRPFARPQSSVVIVSNGDETLFFPVYNILGTQPIIAGPLFAYDRTDFVPHDRATTPLLPFFRSACISRRPARSPPNFAALVDGYCCTH
jgi:hypothetical protein